MGKITISGKQGAGKTTIAKKLAQELGYEHISIGDLHGLIAKEKGITINELMSKGKKDLNIHYEMDKKTKEIGKTKNNFVIDGWIAYHFIPESFKIFLNVDETIGARRILQEKREDEPLPKEIKKAKEKLRQRLKDSDEGFKKAYNISFLNKENYDLVIDTSNLSTKEVIEKIKEKIKNV